MKIICLIPTYNTPINQLAECVQSVIDQSYHVQAIVILDDGSDNRVTTFELGKMINLKPDTLLLIDRSDVKTGTASALNRGHALIDEVIQIERDNSVKKYPEGPYDWVMIHGASDISHPDRVKKQVAYLQAHPETDVLSTGLTAFRGSKSNQLFSFVHPEKPIPGYRKGHDKYFIANHGTVIYRNSAVMKVGGYKEGYGRGQDVELWRRMHESGAIFRAIPQILYYWRR